VAELEHEERALAEVEAQSRQRVAWLEEELRELLVEAAHRERLRSLVARLAGRRVRYREAAVMPHDSSVATAIDGVRRTSLVPPSVRVQRRGFSMLRPPAELVPELGHYRPGVGVGALRRLILVPAKHSGGRPGISLPA
jgi:hypothetical protein